MAGLFALHLVQYLLPMNNWLCVDLYTYEILAFVCNAMVGCPGIYGQGRHDQENISW